MQHKRKTPVKAILLSLVGVCILSGAVLLMVNTIPSPQQPIEKELDAASFLESKPTPLTF